MDEAAHNANRETLDWLDFSIKWANSGGHSKLACLLERVRSEVVFEMDLADVEPPEPRETG